MSDLNYYLIALPFNEQGTQKAQQQYDMIRSQLDLPKEAQMSLFEIPALKVGTLDTLMDASDDLTRVDPQLETTTGKLLQYLEEIKGQSRSEVAKVRPDTSCDQYLSSFKWDDKRYDLREPTKALVDRISGEVVQLEDKVRTKLTEYNEAKKKLGQAQRRETGNLTIKPIAGVVSQFYKQKFGDEKPIDTEYLTTLFIVVPNGQQEDWQKLYWSLGGLEFIIPGSSLVVAKDADYTLNNVVLFKKFLDDYKKECRKKKWVVRDTLTSEDTVGAEMEGLQSSTDEFRAQLIRMLDSSFSECFQAYLHIKALRVFVESVLKYGLPPRFCTIAFRVTEKQERVIRSKLRTGYAFLQSKYEEAPDAGALQNEFPYVSLRLLNVNRTGR
jgi:V-type H+-transporting ATPase subunit C